MLKLLAYRPEGSEADYYRRFILAAQPDIKEEFTRAGILKAERGELDLAVEIFRSMAGLFPECGQTRNNLALVYEQQAARLEAAGAAEEAGPLREQAFAAYKAALAAEPELAACHLNFAHFHLRGGNPGKAREQLELFLKHNTDPERVEQARALAARLEGYEQVERTCAQAFDAIQLGREAEGLELLQPVTREHPELWNAWFLTGWARRRMGDYRQAREAFETSLRPEPRQSRRLERAGHLPAGAGRAGRGPAAPPGSQPPGPRESQDPLQPGRGHPALRGTRRRPAACSRPCCAWPPTIPSPAACWKKKIKF